MRGLALDKALEVGEALLPVRRAWIPGPARNGFESSATLFAKGSQAFICPLLVDPLAEQIVILSPLHRDPCVALALREPLQQAPVELP